jgi:hypothetical protein
VGVHRLPLVAELGHRSLLAVRDEDRVKAEALRTVRPVGDPPFQDPGAADFVALG